MESEYIELLLVEKLDGNIASVIAPSSEATIGNLIEFDGGEIGRVVMKAWAGARESEYHRYVAALVPTYEAEAIYYRSWKAEEKQNAEAGEASK